MMGSVVGIWSDRPGGTMKPDLACCRASVWQSGAWRSTQCSRKPKVSREVDGEVYQFCGLHDPEAIIAKRDKRNKAWEEKWAAAAAESNRKERERVALAACKVAIEQIAAGHNDPRALAAEALALFPEQSP